MPNAVGRSRLRRCSSAMPWRTANRSSPPSRAGRLGVVGGQREGLLKGQARVFAPALVVEDLTAVELDDRGARIALPRLLEPFERPVEPATPLLDQPELEQRAQVARIGRDHRL